MGVRVVDQFGAPSGYLRVFACFVPREFGE